MNHKKRRPIRGLIVRPTKQLKFLTVSLLIIVCLLATMIWMLAHPVLTSIDLISSLSPSNAEIITLLEKALSLGIIGAVAISLLLAAYILWLALRITHKVYGPLVPILRVIDALENGDYSARIRLRKNDELSELASAINRLAERLNNKNKTKLESDSKESL